MSWSVVIPARLASTRLPNKMLLDIDGQPLIAHTVQRALSTSASEVVVATDHEEIAAALSDYDCEVIMTSAHHESGTDRLAEVVDIKSWSSDHVVVNVQGDEPLIPEQLIESVASTLSGADDASVVMATAAKAILEEAAIADPNVVKVVVNKLGNALYFSRSVIPFARDQRLGSVYHHIGIYAYRAGFLRRFAALPPSDLERTESLEQLRVLDHGHNIKVHIVDYDTGIGVDTQQDLDVVRRMVSSQN
ncbi:MAG: 3-deoxy-manno-octulosonate cytidylyltransferase [Pseudomonadota bacterium]